MATTDDRERLEAIANAIMAPHVAHQQSASAKLHGKRSNSRRWLRTGAVLLYLPYVANLLFKVIPEGRMGWVEWVVLLGVGTALYVLFRRQE